MNYQTYIKEALPKPKVIEPSTEPGTITMWHGGNLDDYEDYIVHRTDRNAHGAGLYLISNYSTASRYAKGSRKLYQVVVSKGNDIQTSRLDWDSIKDFVDTWVLRSKRNEILARMQKYIVDDSLKAYFVQNIIMNESAIKTSNLHHLRKFLVDSGIDYEMTSFEGYPMMVLYNMKKIVSVTRVMPNDKIVEFDLPGKFNE
jgi:hypothetical protein